MKNIIFIILALLCLATNAQIWSGSYDMSNGDSVLQTSNIQDISGMAFTLTLDFSDLDTTFIVDVGGSLIQSDPVTHIYLYESANYRHMPYTIFFDLYTAKQQTFTGNIWYFPVPALRFIPNPTETGTITWIMKFYRL